MELDSFLKELESLTNDRSFKPHKYFILLAVLDLFDNESDPKNQILYNDKLCENFTRYYKMYARETDRNRPYTPFFHLKSSNFWKLKALPGKEKTIEKLQTIGGPKELVNNVQYAFLGEDVFQFFTNKKIAGIIRKTIITILESKLGWSDIAAISEGQGIYNSNSLNTSLFEHERKAIDTISYSVKPWGKIINNIYLHDSTSNLYLELDLIIITHSGIYVVELKHWSGKICIVEYNWIINDSNFRADPHRNNGFKCRVLKGVYQHHFRTYPETYVESVVVLTNPEAVVEGASAPTAFELHNPTFASISDFITYLKKKESSEKARLLNDRQIQAIFDYLRQLNLPRPALTHL